MAFRPLMWSLWHGFLYASRGGVGHSKKKRSPSSDLPNSIDPSQVLSPKDINRMEDVVDDGSSFRGFRQMADEIKQSLEEHAIFQDVEVG